MPYGTCSRCGAVHKYVRCPVCGNVPRDCHIRCRKCRKIVPLADSCEKCGAEVEIQSDTHRHYGGWRPWRLPLQTSVFIGIGFVGLLLHWPIVMYAGFAIAAILSVLVAEETMRLLRRKRRCPKCNAYLRSSRAKQCLECGYDWNNRHPGD